MSEPIRIVIVDDHTVVRKGIVLILDDVPDMTVVGEAATGEAAIELVENVMPDIVLMDVKMQGLGGAEATRAIVANNPSARVIGLSTFATRDVVATMIEAGARGYLLKDISATALVEAIREVQGGAIIYPEELLRPESLATESRDSNPVEPMLVLGTQQRRVLALMTKGFTNQEIADKLGISHPTARYHVSAILRKLDVSNRSEAVAMAIRLGVVSAGDF